jgi:hypothetical protein
LGALLRGLNRDKPGPRKKDMSPPATQFRAELERINLDHQVALEAQRISCMPKAELEKVLARNHKNDVLNSFAGLVEAARPWWYAESRKAKHQKIAAGAAAAAQDEPDILGPFPLIYADPPWKFDIYSEKGLERTPDQHYPTLTDREPGPASAHWQCHVPSTLSFQSRQRNRPIRRSLMDRLGSL